MESIRNYLNIFLFISLAFCGGDVNSSFKRYVVANCNILDFSGKVVKKAPGFMCIYFDDGSQIISSYQSGSVRMINRFGSILWRQATEVHHEVELAADKKYFVLLSSEFEKQKENKIFRHDVYEKRKVIDGSLVARWGFKEHWAEIEGYLQKEDKHPETAFHVDNPRYKNFYEITHTNSLHVIPENDLYPKLPFLKPGNLIAGVNCLGMILFFDSDLSKIQKAIHYEKQTLCNIHDAQVLPNGHILFFKNFKKDRDGSSLVEFDPESEKIVWEFKNQNSLPEKSIARGSVQKLSNGNYLVLDVGRNDGKRIVEMNKQGVIAHAIEDSVIKSIGIEGYRARIMPVQKFLDNDHTDF